MQKEAKNRRKDKSSRSQKCAVGPQKNRKTNWKNRADDKCFYLEPKSLQSSENIEKVTSLSEKAEGRLIRKASLIAKSFSELRSDLELPISNFFLRRALHISASLRQCLANLPYSSLKSMSLANYTGV